MKNKATLFVTAMALFLMSAMLVSSQNSIARAAEKTENNSIYLIGKYDSADTAAIRDIDTVRKQIRFRNHPTGKTYTLSYDNTSMMYDARGTVLSASLLEVGQIVDVTFLKSTKHITTLNVSKDAWVVENTRDHELVRGDGTAKIKGEVYKIDARALVMADGGLAMAEDVLSTDKVTVSGIDREIYSVIVTSGHGYVSLSSEVVEDHSLVGAWIELDNEVIHRISPNMLLSAPEGDYKLQIIGNGANYQSEINVSRNQETVVDTSNVNIDRPKEGLVTFEVTPENAEVFVDGEKVLTGTPQSIKYGYHRLKILADDYITQDKYLKVGTPKSVIKVDLEKEDDGSDSSSTEGSSLDTASTSDLGASSASTGASHTESASYASSAASTAATVSANSSQSRTDSNKVIEGYKIYFDKPYDAELYFDGAYIGMIPVSVQKVSGTHEVILKQSGYETKSYRISIDSDAVDLNYTFPKLDKIGADDSSSSSSASSASSDASSAGSSASSDASSAGTSATGADSASTGDSAATADTTSTGASSTGDASTEATTSPATGATTGDSSPAEGSTEAASASTTSSEGASETAGTSTEGTGEPVSGSLSASLGNTNTTSPASASLEASTGASTKGEEATDAATTASGEE